VVPDGRAEAAGILVGDKLVEINGRNVLNTEHEIVASLLRNDILINRCKTEASHFSRELWSNNDGISKKGTSK